MAFPLSGVWSYNQVASDASPAAFFVATAASADTSLRTEELQINGMLASVPPCKLNGSSATPLVSRYSCRATLCRIFRLTFSQCRMRIALHPLKCLKKGPVAPFGGGRGRTSTVQCIDHYSVSRYRGCRSYVSRVALHSATKPANPMHSLRLWCTPAPPMFCIPWGFCLNIRDKCFYIHKTATQTWHWRTLKWPVSDANCFPLLPGWMVRGSSPSL